MRSRSSDFKRIMIVLMIGLLSVGMLINPQMMEPVFAEETQSAQTQQSQQAEDQLLEQQSQADATISASPTENAELSASEGETTKDVEITAGQEAQSAGSEQGQDQDPEAAPEEAEKEAPKGDIGIGEDRYRTVAEAVEAAQDGDTITFYADVKERVTIGEKDLTVDMNGHTWTAAGGSYKQILTLAAGGKVTLKNGTVTGGKNLYDEAKTIVNEGTLSIEKVLFTGNADGLIDNKGNLNIKNSEFTGNDTTRSKGGSMYIIKSGTATSKAYIENTSFRNNNREHGSIIYAYGSSYASQSRNELVLKSCDIADNVVNAYGTVYCSGNVKLTLNDTTIKSNENLSTWDGTGGLYFSTGTIIWEESAIYDNKVPANNTGTDLYLNSVQEFNGSIPLPQDMSDHGKKLVGYELTEPGYNFVATEPITKEYAKRVMNTYYRPWSVKKTDDGDEDAVAQYKGKTYPSIQKAAEAVDEDDAVITLLKDTKAADAIKGRKGLIIDLGGHRLSAKKSTANTLSVTGGEEITIRNGIIADGTGTGSSVYSLYISEVKEVLLEDITFTNIAGRGAYMYHNSPLYDPDTNKMHAEVRNCSFTGNGFDPDAYMPFAFMASGYDLDVTGCTFDGNTYGMRYSNYTTGRNSQNLLVKDCTFKNNTEMALELLNSVTDLATFDSCVFEDNHVSGYEDAIINLEEAGSGASTHGGDKVFKNCVIRNNSGATYTLYTEVGVLTANDTLIQGNKATNTGGIYVSLDASLKLKDTVIKENEATGTSTTCSGGVALFSATKILITPSVNGSVGGSQDLGFSSAGLIMEGGAIYNNKTAMSSPSAEDLFVSSNCSVVLPRVAEFKDGDKDFTGLMWKEDASGELKDIPENTVAQRRYFMAGARSNIKQVYVDGVNGTDVNDGTKTSPVKTIDRANELANSYGCTTIMVLGTVTYAKNEEEQEEGLLSVYADEEDGKDVIDLDGKTLKRDPGLTKEPLITVEDGANVTVKNTVMDGNKKFSVKALAPLVKVEKGGELTLDEGALLHLNGISTSNTNPKGGAVWTRGKVIMKDGATIRDNYAITGGGICVDGGTFRMLGGTIEHNIALWRTGSDYKESCGGGVCVINGGAMIMEDGLIIRNEGLLDGGGISLGTQSSNTVTEGSNRLYMTGGTIEGNKAYNTGGGVFIQCSTEARIVGGSILDNIAQARDGSFAGGGIYVNGYHSLEESALGVVHGRLFMTNVEIAGNTADWEGGAIGVCGSGEGVISNVKGTVIYDNDSNGKGNSWHKKNVGKDGVGSEGYNGDFDVLFDDVITEWDYSNQTWIRDEYNMFNKESQLRYQSFLTESMLNGASYDWADENGDPADVETLHAMKKFVRLNTDATASDADVQESVKLARVHVNGNHSNTNAGGIGNNGFVFIGQLPEFVDVEFEKKWDDKGFEKERPSEIRIWLRRDGKKIDSMIVRPDENGKWSGTFTELLKYEVNDKGEPDTDKPYTYTVEEDMEYAAEGEKTLKDRYTAATRVEEDGTITVTNTFVPPEEPPEEPPVEEVPPEEPPVNETPPEEPPTKNEPPVEGEVPEMPPVNETPPVEPPVEEKTLEPSVDGDGGSGSTPVYSGDTGETGKENFAGSTSEEEKESESETTTSTSTKKTKSPGTGDDTGITLFVLLALTAAAVLVVTARARKE